MRSYTTTLIGLVCALSWAGSARADTHRGRLTHVGVERTEDGGAFVVASIAVEGSGEATRSAEPVFGTELDSVFGRHVFQVAQRALREHRAVTVVLGQANDKFYGRPQLISLVFSE